MRRILLVVSIMLSAHLYASDAEEEATCWNNLLELLVFSFEDWDLYLLYPGAFPPPPPAQDR